MRNLAYIAKEHCLQLVETTCDTCGEHDWEHQALTGFDSFKEAQEIVDYYPKDGRLVIVLLHKHKDEKLWHGRDELQPYELNFKAKDYGGVKGYRSDNQFLTKDVFDAETRKIISKMSKESTTEQLDSYSENRRNLWSDLTYNKIAVVYEDGNYIMWDIHPTEWELGDMEYCLAVVPYDRHVRYKMARLKHFSHTVALWGKHTKNCRETILAIIIALFSVFLWPYVLGLTIGLFAAAVVVGGAIGILRFR